MEFRNLKKQYEVLKKDIDSGVTQVCSNCNFISGKEVTELENQLAKYVGVKHCISCANGTEALSLVLMAWGIKEGDAVFVPNFTFFASAETVSFEGATPVFVDVNKETFNIDTNSLKKEIARVKKEGKLKAKAIISVDLFGLSANYVEIEKIAKEENLLVLEDSAQGFGGRINEKLTCSFGDAATTSFFPAKPLGCYGDGGAIFTNNDELSALIRSYAVHGKGSFKYDNVRIGINSRLDTIQAAILKVKFKAFVDYELDKVNNAAKYYSENLKDIVKIPVVPENYYSSWAQYTITLKNNETRDSLAKFLQEKNIPTMVYYPKSMSEQTAYKGTYSQNAKTPVAKELCETVLSLPIGPYIEKDEQDLVIKAIKEFFYE